MPFLGMRGTGDWTDKERPENWRETILYLYPNGSAPIVGIMSMMGSESTDDPSFNWFTKKLPEQAGDTTGIFTSAALDTQLTSASKDDTAYVKASAETIAEFREGHTATLSDKESVMKDVFVEITGRSLSGSNSYVQVLFLEEPPSGWTPGDDVKRIMVSGNANAEGATMPDALRYDPTPYRNVTQIWRTPLSITRTAKKTRLRTGDSYQLEKREALELHSIEMEKAIVRSQLYEGIGTNNKPKRTTRGIINFLKEFAPENIKSFTDSDPAYNGKTWVEAGEDWLDERLEYVSRYGDSEKLALCGSGALRALNKLAKIGGDINLEPMTTDYGLQVIRWRTASVILHLKVHPLMSYEPTTRFDMLIIEPRRFKFRYIDDTHFIDEKENTNTNNGKDGQDEEYLTEGGIELHHPMVHHYLGGVGRDNTH